MNFQSRLTSRITGEPLTLAELEEGFLRDGWVKVRAFVKKLLPDDVFGAKHQRFVVGLGGSATGESVLVAHNIDTAPRAPVKPGDVVHIRGFYKVDSQTGQPLLHFTHRAAGGGPGGFIASPEKKWIVQ